MKKITTLVALSVFLVAGVQAGSTCGSKKPVVVAQKKPVAAVPTPTKTPVPKRVITTIMTG